MKKLSLAFIVMLCAGNGYAEGMNAKDIYFGGGLGMNSLSGIDFSDGLGFQLLAGYDLPVKMGKGKLSIEAGYMDSGNMEGGARVVPIPNPPFFRIVAGEIKAKGFWGNAVYSLPLQDKLNLLGRVGLDVGDDDGLMFGAGMGFEISPKMEMRGEYVIRDNVDSLQANFIFRL